MAENQNQSMGRSQQGMSMGQRHGMSRSQAGQKGGQTTAQRHGHDFYAKIGREGGRKSSGKFTPGSERARQAGKKGGEARRAA